MLGIFVFSAQLLDEEILPLVVAISGRAGSETPISCEFSGLRGVILEETVCILNF
jgi:E3 ubiquitin-protein ligase MUL1